ncbi:MAG: recombination protein RecR [Clostridia bacterium]|nr:recombination protein RecR [Clostridia bacterium]
MANDPIGALVSQLSRLPGVGAKSAQRLAYFILDMPEPAAREIASAINRARDTIHHCPVCGNYTDSDPCSICRDPSRRSGTLCVVEDARDVISMEKMREFRGGYHVLGGTISPMDGVGPDDIRIRELMDRLDKENITEVILATNPDVEGEATASYLARLLKPLGVRCTRIAHGVPVGGDLEYTDEVTLLKAMEGRREV